MLTIWLQVREENQVAISLYQKEGFIEHARRTTWHSQKQKAESKLPILSKAKIRPRISQDWKWQRQWLNAIYPQEVIWYLPLDLNLLKPGFMGSLNRFFSDRGYKNWSAVRENTLLGVLTWQSSARHADRLWLAPNPDFEEAAIQALLPFVCQSHPAHRTLALDYPANQANAVLEETGFFAHQTLIWMKKQL